MLDGVRVHLQRETPWPLLALGIAAWMRYVSGVDDAGNSIDIRDPLADKIHAIVETSSVDERVTALLTLKEIFGSDLPHNPTFVNAINRAWQTLTTEGAHAAVKRALDN